MNRRKRERGRGEGGKEKKETKGRRKKSDFFSLSKMPTSNCRKDSRIRKS